MSTKDHGFVGDATLLMVHNIDSVRRPKNTLLAVSIMI